VKWTTTTTNTKQRECPTIFYTKSQQGNKKDLIDGTLLTRLKVNGF
jgi:hypothetical protein